MINQQSLKNNQKFFIGIDLGGKTKPTTGLCVLKTGDQKVKIISCRRACPELAEGVE